MQLCNINALPGELVLLVNVGTSTRGKPLIISGQMSMIVHIHSCSAADNLCWHNCSVPSVSTNREVMSNTSHTSPGAASRGSGRWKKLLLRSQRITGTHRRNAWSHPIPRQSESLLSCQLSDNTAVLWGSTICKLLYQAPALKKIKVWSSHFRTISLQSNNNLTSYPFYC